MFINLISVIYNLVIIVVSSIKIIIRILIDEGVSRLSFDRIS